jgi:hypothetical protein
VDAREENRLQWQPLYSVAVRTAIVASIVFLACSPPPPDAPVNRATPSAENILQAMRERYRTAKTYRDEGHFRDVFHRKDQPGHVESGRFRTMWGGSERLAFELHVDPGTFFPGQTMAVWTPKSGGVKSLHLGAVKDEDSVSDALYAMQGVSHYITGLVPRVLVGGDCTGNVHYEVRATVPCGNATCFELERTSNADHTSFFIDTKTSALRKYVQRATITPTDPPELRNIMKPEEYEEFRKRSHEPFDVESTIEIEPSFDVAVDDQEFEGPKTGLPSPAR